MRNLSAVVKGVVQCAVLGGICCALLVGASACGDVPDSEGARQSEALARSEAKLSGGCGGPENIACPTGEYCKYSAGVCGATQNLGTCQPVDAACSPNASPVCACDGVTYTNECFAGRAGQSVWYSGECGTTCGGFAGTKCAADQFCDHLPGQCPAQSAPGICRQKPASCQPGSSVCGCNGLTYASACEAERAGIAIQHLDGACIPGDSDGDGLPDSVETNTHVFVGPNDTGTDPMNPDTDGDGISDGDEVLGAGTLNLPALGVNPLHKDILLEYDWFDDALECAAHSHRPTPASIAIVTNAFANAPVSNPDGTMGIKLINDYGQGGVFTGGNRIVDSDGVLGGGFDAEYYGYKSANFAANREGYFHYVVMPHRYNTNSGSSGLAEIVGDDLIVSLYCSNSDSNVGNTIMHELGHNLGLQHGGDEPTNYKPNYNSVMNYMYQWGIDTDCKPGGETGAGYSRNAYITLDENALLERKGICGNVSWDWNGNGRINTSSVQVDVNGDGTRSVLHDFDDWAHLVYDWNGSLRARGVTSSVVVCDNPVPSK